MMDASPDRLRIVMAQDNPTVGALEANCELVRKSVKQAADMGADLVVFSELFITGYPPEDLVLKPAFAQAARTIVEALATELAGGPGVLLGTVWPEQGHVYNAVVLIDQGRVQAVRTKVDLPNYGVFDEKRVFTEGPMPGPVDFRGVRIGVPICEDIWQEDVCECLAESGAELFIVPNGSPYEHTKQDVRIQIAVTRVTENRLPLMYVNQLGGQDELVFDGASFVLNANAELAVQCAAWQPALTMTEWTREDAGWVCAPGEKKVLAEGDASTYQACMLGVRDYVNKNGFPGVVLGLSGGIDSALVAALAVDALGAERVHCIMLPYAYTSEESLADAAQCANALGMRYDVIPIQQPVEGFQTALASLFAGQNQDVTEENLQSRARGTILMAVSNKFGAMVLTTGNKSEMAVGYATLYGDMNGGFNPIKDLYKTEVYRVAAWRNDHHPEGAKGPKGEVIPKNILTKAPTAELREGQTDQDNLPEYDVLDDILRGLIEERTPVPDIIARGHPKAVVQRVEQLLYIAEYKRRQAAPGVKISAREFGRDRRYPITNKFRENPEALPQPEGHSIHLQTSPRLDGGDL